MEFENDGMFDLYIWKVETIGDAYMVASGVPVPNGNMHAMEVSMMSLDLLAKILTFEIQVIDSDDIIFFFWSLACLKRFTKRQQMLKQMKHKITTSPLHIVQHKPGSRLKLRMGMHSGRVVGGVVGTKIPHYSVFG